MSDRSPLVVTAADRGLCLRDLAQQTGYSRSTLEKVSRGALTPWPKLRQALVTVLGVDVFAEEVDR